jgi:hypothetical protein
MNINQLVKILPPPQGTKTLVTRFQNTEDLSRAITASHKENLKFARQIAPYFRGSNNYQTGKNIHAFLRQYVPYKVEPGSSQTTKTLPRMLNDANRGIGSDCKHYSVFTGTVLDALGIPFVYRLAGYVSNTPQHIYAVIKEGNKETPVDAVLPQYNYEKKPLKKYDMSLYKLSGVTSAKAIEFENDFAGFGALVNDYKRMGIDTDQLGKIDIKKSIQKIKQGAKTIGLAVPRNAFNLLVKENVFGFATKMKTLYDKKGRDGFSFWVNLGGNRDELIKIFESGAKKKAILGEPVTFTAALASAVPIILAFKDTLKKSGIDAETITAAGAQAADAFRKVTGTDVKKVIFKKEEGVTASSSQISTEDLKPATEAQAQAIVASALTKGTGLKEETFTPPKKGFNLDFKDPKILIGTGLLIYFITKK